MAIGVEIQDLPFKAAEEADKVEIQADGGGLGSSYHTTVDSIVQYVKDSGIVGVTSVVGGTNVVVDDTDPGSPIVNVPTLGVETISSGVNISINNTDPAHPVISAPNVVTSVDAGDSIEITGTNAVTVSLSDTIKAGSLNLVTIYENGSGTLGIGNLSTGAIQIGNGATADIAIRNMLWPTADGTIGQVLTTNGAGVLSWEDNDSGQVNSIVAGESILVDDTDPTNPVVAVNHNMFENTGTLVQIANNASATVSIAHGNSGLSRFGSEGNNVQIGALATGSVTLGFQMSSGSIEIGTGTGAAPFTLGNDTRSIDILGDPVVSGSGTFGGTVFADGSNFSKFIAGDSTTTDSSRVLLRSSSGGIDITTVGTNGNGFIRQTNAAGSLENQWAVFSRDAGVQLNYNGTIKFQTVSSGVTVTGDVNIQGLNYAWPVAHANGVLTNNGSGGLSWEAPAAPSLRLIGQVLVTKTANQSISNATSTSVSWDAEEYDTLNAWTSGTNITVPTGVSFARITINLGLDGTPTGSGSFAAFTTLNGNLPTGGIYERIGATTAFNNPRNNGVSSLIPVTPGDVIVARVFQDTGAAMDLEGAANVTWALVEWYE